MTTIITKEGNRELSFDEARLRNFMAEVGAEGIADKIVRNIVRKEKESAENITQTMINELLGEVDESTPELLFVASHIYLRRLYKQASRNRACGTSEVYSSYYGLQKKLASMGVYSGEILEKYSKEEIEQASELIVPERDFLFNYAGIETLASRYLAVGFSKEPYELPQERWLTISLIMHKEEAQDKRMENVAESYWALSNLYMTVATPTLANAGKPQGQLSSCFIDTVDDSLRDIYDSNTDIGTLSKGGGGIGQPL